MRFHKFLSILLHPIFIPTLGVFLYFQFVSQSITIPQQRYLLGLIFIITFIIPVLSLIILKAVGLVDSFHVRTIRERRFPLFLMTGLFFLLGNLVMKITLVRDLGLLFYGTSLSLALIYMLFAARLKSSLHLVSMGNAIGFFLIISNQYYLPLLPLIMVLLILSGLLASSRLYLKAHTPIELFLGFSIGIVSQVVIFLLS